MTMLTSALHVWPEGGASRKVDPQGGDEAVALLDYGPHVTELIRELVTHVELLKQHVDTMYTYCEPARRATFASRQAATDLVRFAFVFPGVLREFGLVLAAMDAIRFGNPDPVRERELA